MYPTNSSDRLYCWTTCTAALRITVDIAMLYCKYLVVFLKSTDAKFVFIKKQNSTPFVKECKLMTEYCDNQKLV